MTKRYAILDVDNTLLYNTNDFNINFIKSLKAQGITEIILFSKMSLNDIKNKAQDKQHASRIDLISLMKEHGLNTNFVCMPQDCSYKNGKAGEYFNDIYMDYYNQMLEHGLDRGKPSQYWIEAELARAYLNQTIDIADGKLNQDVNIEFISNFEVPTGAKERKKITVKEYLEGERNPILIGVNQKLSLKYAGKGYKTEKGFMAESLLDRIISESEEDIELFYADDKQECLDDFHEAVKRISNKTGRSIFADTFNIPNSWYRAANFNYMHRLNEFKTKLREHHSLKQRVQQCPSILTRGGIVGWFSNKEQARQDLLDGILNHGNAETWLSLAAMAETGTGLYENNQNLLDCYHLLMIAQLRAENDTQYIKALIAYSEFLTKYPIHKVLNSAASKVIVANSKQACDIHQGAEEVTLGMTAKQLLNEMKRSALNHNDKTKADQEIRLRLIYSYGQRNASLKDLTPKNELDKKLIDTETRRTSASIKRIQEMQIFVNENPLAWDSHYSHLAEIKDETSQAASSVRDESQREQSIIAASSSSSTTAWRKQDSSASARETTEQGLLLFSQALASSSQSEQSKQELKLG